MPGKPSADEIHRLKAQIGGYVRRGNHTAADDTRRELALRLAERGLSELPPLTHGERRRLIRALPSGAAS